MMPTPVGQDVGLLEVLGGEEHGGAVVAGQPGHLIPQAGSALQVKARRGLVEEQDGGPVDESHGQVQSPFHAA
jgi:hypothetical protein